jgi:hypothetical protein
MIKLMTEKIADFFKEIKERISSPLISSFIISWLVINWKFIVTLFKFETKELKLTEYKLFVEYLSEQINLNNSLSTPFSVAIFYTLVYPFIRNGVQILNAWFRAWGTTYTMRASKSNKVSIEKYIQLRDVYKTRTGLLEDVLEKESKTIRENEELRNQTISLRSKINEADSALLKNKELIDRISQENDTLRNEKETLIEKNQKFVQGEKDLLNKEKVVFLNGKWKREETTIKYGRLEDKVVDIIKFRNGVVYNVDNNGIEQEIMHVDAYFYYSDSNNVHITFRDLVDRLHQYILIADDTFSILKGKIKGKNVEVTLERIEGLS